MRFHGHNRPQVSPFKAAERRMQKAARECARKDKSVAKLRERLDRLDRGVPDAAEVDDTASVGLEAGKYLALVGLDVALIGAATAYLAQGAFPGNQEVAYAARFILPVLLLMLELLFNETLYGGGAVASKAAAAMGGTLLVGILVALTMAAVMESETMPAVAAQNTSESVVDDNDLFEPQAGVRQDAPQATPQSPSSPQEVSSSRRLLGRAQAALVAVIHLWVVFDPGSRIAFRRLLRRLLRRPVANRMQTAEADAAKAKEALAVALEDYHAEFQTKSSAEHPGPFGTDVIRAVNAIYGRATLIPAEPATVTSRSGVAVAGDDEIGPRMVEKTTEGPVQRAAPGREFDDDGDVRPPFSREL